MAKCKGKFINFVGGLMGLYKEERDKADEALFAKSGKHFGEFENEDFYDTKLIKLALEAYAKASPTGRNAIITMGRGAYPLIDRTVGLPRELMKTPLDAIKFEAQNFLVDVQPDDGTPVVPRKFHLFEEGHVIVEAPMPDFDSILNKGVYLGIFKILGITTVKVEMIDENKAIFDITW